MTLADIKLYLYIDSDNEDTYLTQLIEVSQIYIDLMVGEDYKTNEKAVKLADLLQKKLCSDLYENRGTEIASNTKKDIIVTSLYEVTTI
jgi:uncharacterized phage protein (predicted DNA packaging)